MVYPSKKKKTTFRKRFGKKFYKRFNKSSFKRTMSNKGSMHFFKRTQIVNLVLDRSTAQSDPVTGHNIWAYANAGNNAYFSLDQTDGYTDFTALFDRYKLCGLKWELMAYNQSSDIGSGTNGWVTNLNNFVGLINVHTCLDYDDGTTTANIARMGQVHSYKRFVLNGVNKAKRYLKPRTLSMAYETGVTTAYSPKIQWIDCADSNVPHYGIKFIIEDPRTFSAGQDAWYLPLQLKLTHYFAFKDPL